MKISWFQLVKAIPEVKDAIAPVCEGKNWMASKSLWYQLIKSGVTVLTALGLYAVLSDADVQTISASLAILVPTVCTLLDALTAAWLRLRTTQPIVPKVKTDSVENSGGVSGTQD